MSKHWRISEYTQRRIETGFDYKFLFFLFFSERGGGGGGRRGGGGGGAAGWRKEVFDKFGIQFIL